MQEWVSRDDGRSTASEQHLEMKPCVETSLTSSCWMLQQCSQPAKTMFIGSANNPLL